VFHSNYRPRMHCLATVHARDNQPTNDQRRHDTAYLNKRLFYKSKVRRLIIRTEHKNTMSRHSEYSTLSRITHILLCTITWHKEFSDMLNFSKNFLFFMSIISHIVNHLNSLIQCRTISVDLTSNILRKQLSTTYWRDAV